MAKHRTVAQRVVLGILWFGISVGAIGGIAYSGAWVWLERNTVVVNVVDSDGKPVVNAEVSKMLFQTITS